MATFELSVSEKMLNVKIRASVNGGIEIASMTRDGSLHKSFLRGKVPPNLGDNIVTINEKDVSRVLPDEALAILKVALADDMDVILGFSRHYSGICLDPIGAQDRMNREWNKIDALTQWASIHRSAHNVVRNNVNETMTPRKAETAIKEHEAIWRKEQEEAVNCIIFGEKV